MNLDNAKPIIFCTDMVKAIITGNKTITRRVIDKDISNRFDVEVSGKPIAFIDQHTGDSMKPEAVAPYRSGYILYVRETFYQYGEWYDIQQRDEYDEVVSKHTFVPKRGWPIYHVDEFPSYMKVKKGYKSGLGYYKRPSLFMPKEAARIFLRVTAVRAEQVQDITEEDARREGCIDFHDKIGDGKFDDVVEFDLTARDAFIDLWNSINGKRGNDWMHNPWVWAYTFERITED